MASIITYIMGILLGCIFLIAVLLPVTKTVLSDAALTGSAKTIGDLFPLFIVLGGVLLVVSIYRT